MKKLLIILVALVILLSGTNVFLLTKLYGEKSTEIEVPGNEININNEPESPLVESSEEETVDYEKFTKSEAVNAEITRFYETFERDALVNAYELAIDETRDIVGKERTIPTESPDVPLETRLYGTKLVSKEVTYLLANNRINEAVTEIGSYENCIPLEAIEFLLDQEVTFCMNIADDGPCKNEVTGELYIPCYTVFKSELGGCIFIWFDHYTSLDYIFVKEMTYLDYKLSSADFADAKNINDVLKLTRAVYPLTKNKDAYGDWRFGSKHLLTDGVLVINYSREDGTIDNMTLYEDFKIPHLPPDLDSDWINRNWTIFEEDYPPYDLY